MYVATDGRRFDVARRIYVKRRGLGETMNCKCPSCNSNDVDEQDLDYNLDDGWLSATYICNECGCLFQAEATIIIDDIKETE